MVPIILLKIHQSCKNGGLYALVSLQCHRKGTNRNLSQTVHFRIARANKTILKTMNHLDVQQQRKAKIFVCFCR